MDEFLRYTRRMTLVMAGVGLGVAAILWVVRSPAPAYADPWVNAYLLGLAAALLVFRLVDVPTVLATVAQPSTNAAKTYYLKMFKTLLLYGCALLAMFRAPAWFNAWGGLLGMLTPRALLMLDSALRPQLFLKKTDPAPTPTPYKKVADETDDPYYDHDEDDEDEEEMNEAPAASPASGKSEQP